MAYQPITNLATVIGAQGGMPVTGTVGISNASLAVTGTFWQAVQPVSGTVTVGNASLAVTGPLTDTQLRASALPVSLASSVAVTGTFWQATQPVSIASTVNVSVQNASLAVTGPLTDAQLRATAVPVSLASTTVTGTVAVSGPLTDTQLRATAVPVSGTFFQATQPVSIAATVAVSGPLTDTQLRASAVPVSLASLPTLAAGSNTIGTTLGPTITKGTQGTTGYTTQDLKDAGRVSFAASTVIAGVTAVTAEAMLSMVPVRDGVAAVGNTTFSVTSGKRLRISKIMVSGLTTAAAVLSARVALRMNPTGAVVATSPIIALAALNGPAAVALTGDHAEIILPDGFEISGTQQIGLSHVAAAATGTIRASIIGYEY